MEDELADLRRRAEAAAQSDKGQRRQQVESR
jgi:hypothetical protein